MRTVRAIAGVTVVLAASCAPTRTARQPLDVEVPIHWVEDPSEEPTSWPWAACGGPLRVHCMKALTLLTQALAVDRDGRHSPLAGSALAELWEARSSFGPTPGVFLNSVEDDVRGLTGAQRSWLADLVYDITLVSEYRDGCRAIGQNAKLAARLDASPRNRQRADYLTERCGDRIPGDCRPERIGPDAIGVDWQQLREHPEDYDLKRVRISGWLEVPYESPVRLWSTRRDAEWDYWGSLPLGKYAGGQARVDGCLPGPGSIEGRLVTMVPIERGLTPALEDWRVVTSSGWKPDAAPRERRAPLSAIPDAGMLRVPTGDLAAKWRDGETAPRHVEAFDIDRHAFRFGTFRTLALLGKLEPWHMYPPDDVPSMFDGLPLTCVTPVAAAELCSVLGKRLPSEEEWVRAAPFLASTAEIQQADDPSPPTGAPSNLDCGLPAADVPAGWPTGWPAALQGQPSRIAEQTSGLEEWTSTPYCPPGVHCQTFDRVVRGALSMAQWSGERSKGFVNELHVLRGFRCAR